MKIHLHSYVSALIIATSIEKANLHRRIALGSIKMIGSSPRLLMAGFMTATSVLSMWISNTATSAMMIPILEVVLKELEDPEVCPDEDEDVDANSTDKDPEALEREKIKAEKKRRNMRAMLAMAICFSANIGGTGTLIGTGSNVVLTEFLGEFPGNPVSFGSWMLFAVPQMLFCLVAAWLWLQIYYIGFSCKTRSTESYERKKAKQKLQNAAVARVIQKKYDELGPITFHEGSVMVLFLTVLLLWFFEHPGFMTGWADGLATTNPFGHEVSIDDATPTVLVMLALFFLPAKPYFLEIFKKDGKPLKSSPPLLDWKTAQDKVPWGIILLLGGGYALAEASEQSCLSAWIGHQLTALEGLADWIISLIGCVIANLMTQVASNAASVSIVLPVMSELALHLSINPLYLMIPPTLACSYAFMLPISTGPNAIVFGPSGMTIMEMVKVGSVMNLICLGIVTLCMNTYGYILYDFGSFPQWAQESVTVNGTDVCASYY